MSNWTAVFHQERIPDTQIISSFSGMFIPILIPSNSDSYEITDIEQICVQYSNKIKIYGIKSEKINEENINKLYLLNIYEIFDKIEYSEKFHSLLNNKNINSIILSLSSYKISIIEYDMQFNTFNTLALYSIDQFLLGGRMNVEKSFRIVSSLTYNYIAFIYDENKLSLLRKKKNVKKNDSLGGGHSGDHSYSDTINGEKYFLPTIYLNDLNIKYNIYKIINIYIPNKNFELIYLKLNEENKSKKKELEKIRIYILYIESKGENLESNKNINNINENENNNNNMINEQNQMNFNSYMRERVSLGLLSYDCKTNEYVDFEILFSGIDENAFDFTILEKSNDKINNNNDNNNDNDNNHNTAIIFSAYNLQIINLKTKKSMNYITDNYYSLIFSKIYTDFNKYQINNYFFNNNLDLRGSGFLVLNDSSFIFSDSKGKLIYTVFDENDDIFFEEITIDNEYKRLCAPYNHILMPYVNIFFLSSSVSDGIILSYNRQEKNYKTTDKIISYSPIVNFHLVNDTNGYMKFAFTSGYGENSCLSFAYDQFLFFFYEYNNNFQELYDIDNMKSVNSIQNDYTKYILCKLKNQNLVVFQNINNDLVNNSSIINYDKNIKIINFGQININSTHEKIIVLIFEKEIKFYNNDFNLLFSMNNNFYNEDILINKSRVGDNLILLYNNNIKKRYFILGLYSKKIEENNKNNNNIMEIKIDQQLYIRYKELTQYIYKDINDLVVVNINSKLYLDKYIFLLVYRNNTTIEIYDITDFLEYKDNMDIEGDDNNNNLKLLLLSKYINYSPPLILSDDLNKNILYRSNSNPIIDFSNSINNLFNLNENEMNINNNTELGLKSSVSFSIDSPDFIFLESLGDICILFLIFKSGILLIYTLYISEMTEDNKEIKSIGFKKKIIEKLINIDYRVFFRIDLDNLFIPFSNLDKKSGILFNLESNRKLLYEINGELCLLKINNKMSKFSSFCNFNSEKINNGFLIYEGGLIKYCNLYKDYSLSNYSLFIKTYKINRFPVLLTYTPEFYMNNTFYSYIMIEKEMISTSKFQYYMTLRKEEKQPLSEIKFEENETVTECNVIELPITIGNINNTKKYIAVGINIIDDDLGENSFINSKIKLYNNDNNQFELVAEKTGFKGIITMIVSLYNYILVVEGSRINSYQFIPGGDYIMNKDNYNYLENKNLAICNRIQNKILLIGDIVDSFNFIFIKLPNNQIEMHLDTKDNNHIKVTTCNLWPINKKNCCILFDEDNNGYIYLLSDNTSTRICDFNINKNINEIRSKYIKNQNDSYSYYYSSLNGSVGFFNHIENDIYEKLNYLCEFIYFHFPFNSGVNPKVFYTINYENNSNNNFQKPTGRFIDFNILDIFLKLSDKLQDVICNNILGENKNVIIQNIYNLID